MSRQMGREKECTCLCEQINDRWMKRQAEREMNGSMDRLRHGWVDRWTGGWMDACLGR